MLSHTPDNGAGIQCEHAHIVRTRGLTTNGRGCQRHDEAESEGSRKDVAWRVI
jgi:hypothetical protein